MDRKKNTEINIEEVRRKRRNSKRFRILAKWFAVLFLIGCVYAVVSGKVNRWFQKDASGIGFTYSADSRASFYISDKGIFHATKDGVKYYALKDLSKWQYNDTFSMTSPTVCSNGNYLGVFDYKGTQFGVYGEDGMLYTAQTDAPIIYMDVNVNGWAVVLTESESKRVVGVYNTVGAWTAGTIYEEPNRYPLTACLSNDGRILAISLLDTGEGSTQELVSYISLFYINKSEGLDYKDNMFFSLEKKDSIIPYLYFNQDNTLFCLGDAELFFIDAEQKIERWRIPYTNMLSKADFTNGYAALSFGQPFSGAAEALPGGTVVVYNEKGSVTGEFNPGADVTYLNAKDTIVIGCGRSFYGITTRGKLSWEYKAMQDVSQFLSLSAKNGLMVSKSEANIVSLQNQTSEEPALDWEEDLPENPAGGENIPVEITPEPAEENGGSVLSEDDPLSSPAPEEGQNGLPETED